MRMNEQTLIAHLCHVPGCPTAVPRKMLMCRSHWARVPLKLRQKVWAAYRSGQEVDKQPSAEWLHAAKAAIDAVKA